MKEILEAYADLRKERDELADYKQRADVEFKKLLPLVDGKPGLIPPGTKANISQLVEIYIHRLETENKKLKADAQVEKDVVLERVQANGPPI